jgi:hypothetical protein
MARFAKSFLLDITLLVVGYIAYSLVKVVGRMTLRLGHAVFSK